MASVDVRVNIEARVPWNILGLVFRFESRYVCPILEDLYVQYQDVTIGVSPLIRQLESLQSKIERLIERSETLQEQLIPVWDDAYNLCGDPTCDGTCVVCLDGEYDGEEAYTEKYCKRGRR